MDKFSNKKIAILGFGVEGMSIADFLQDSHSQITVLDEKKRADFDEKMLIAYEERGIIFQMAKIEDLSGFDIVFRSPGFHPNLSVLEEAKKKGMEVTSSTKVFFDLCPCPIVGVTGTKGKGTTSTLIYEMLKAQEFDAYLGGNIGTPPLEFLPKLTKDSKVVLELSSFQLMDLGKSPHVAVMLMTTSEHLDYHKDVYEYINAKRNIFRFQNEADFAVVNKDYPASNESDIESMGKVYRVSREQGVDQGCFVRGESIVLKMGEEEEVILSTNDIALPGKHNLENVCAAIVAALCAGCTMKSIIPVLKKFQGLPHRIEFIRLVNGVKYYNDSFSTTPETSIAAIEAFEEPKILILGGSSKKSDFSELGKVIRESKSMKAIIGIGLEWAKIKESISHQPSGVQYVEGLKTMEEIVDEAARLGTVGDVVLLSPGCASFDMFKSYKDRGEQFRSAVQAL
jgi:UDP-N-acetylmuramoylalanine--D-glutamate ligase